MNPLYCEMLTMVPMAPVSQVRTAPVGELLISKSTAALWAGTILGKAGSDVRDKIASWDSVFGKWCHSNSSLKGDSRLWTAWAGRKGNRSPTGTVIFFHYLRVCVKAGLLAGNQNPRRGSDKALEWETLQSHHELLAALLTPPPNLCIREETNPKQSLIKYLIVTLTSPTSQQYFALTQRFNDPGEISQGFFRLATAE